jgi:hypothetical protein
VIHRLTHPSTRRLDLQSGCLTRPAIVRELPTSALSSPLELPLQPGENPGTGEEPVNNAGITRDSMFASHEAQLTVDYSGILAGA